MPHLDADEVNMASETDGDFRGRSGSNSSTGSAVFRGIFRKKNKSEHDSPHDSQRGSSPMDVPGATGGGTNKVKNLFDSFRPRSKSDAQKKPIVKQPLPQRKVPGDGRHRHQSTPMSRLLSVDSPMPPSRNTALLEEFRSRAFSDPRSSLQAARRAAANKVPCDLHW